VLITVGVAYSKLEEQYLILVPAMLLLPLLDRQWILPVFICKKKQVAFWSGLIVVTIINIIFQPGLLEFALSTLLFAAIPEEWFFRAYLMTRLGKGVKANLIASICFSCLHFITKGWVSALLVFLPSLFFGWVYQKQNDIIFLVFLHSLSNVVYIGFIHHKVAWLYVY